MGMTKEKALRYASDMHSLAPGEVAYEQEMRQKNPEAQRTSR
jgi:hypothetical protein